MWFNEETDPEKHYCELIMFFTPWRNEETDLIGFCSSYHQHYMHLTKAIKEEMKQYVACYENFNEIKQEMNNVEDAYDSIAPAAQSVEHQDQSEGSTDLHPDFNENYNMSDDTGIPSVDEHTELLILNELHDYEYRHMVQISNKEQKEFFFHVLSNI